jgi:hypothetical protein
VRGTLDACGRRLNRVGLLAVNIPNAGGLAYRTARRLKRVGVGRPYDGLWQTGLPSPHLHYFTAPARRDLLAQAGVRTVSDELLAAVTRDGLWERVDRFRGVTPGQRRRVRRAVVRSPILNRPTNSDILFLLAERMPA